MNIFQRLRLFFGSLSPAHIAKSRAVRARYETIVELTKDAPMEFMNYGYAPIEGEDWNLLLAREEEYYRFPISLYWHVLASTKFEGHSVLEIGSGRGGGADFVMRTFKPRRLVALDLSSKQIELSRKRYPRSNLQFVQGNAECLPFSKEGFDIVYNIESSHCYLHQDMFFDEVYRVLRSGGRFLYADFRYTRDLQRVRDDLRNAGFKIEKEADITRNVLRALDLDQDRKSELIAKVARDDDENRRFRVGYAMKGDDIQMSRYYKFASGENTYFSFVLEKSQ